MTPLFIGLIFGLFLGFRKKHRELTILLIYYLSYFLLLIITKVFYGRYVVPILPILYIFGAGFIYILVKNISKNKITAMFFICSAIVLVPPTFQIYKWHKALQGNDTRKEFLQWRAKQKFLGGKVLYLTHPAMAVRAIQDNQREILLWDRLDQKTKDLFPIYRAELFKKISAKTKNILEDPNSDFKYFVLSSEFVFDKDAYEELLEALTKHCLIIYQINPRYTKRQDREFFLFIPYNDNSQNQRVGPYIAVFKKVR